MGVHTPLERGIIRKRERVYLSIGIRNCEQPHASSCVQPCQQCNEIRTYTSVFSWIYLKYKCEHVWNANEGYMQNVYVHLHIVCMWPLVLVLWCRIAMYSSFEARANTEVGHLLSFPFLSFLPHPHISSFPLLQVSFFSPSYNSLFKQYQC